MEKFAPGIAAAGAGEIASFQGAWHRPTASLPRMISYVVGKKEHKSSPRDKGTPVPTYTANYPSRWLIRSEFNARF